MGSYWFRWSVVLVSLFTISCSFKEPEVGSKDRPFRMFFIPSMDAHQISKTADDLTSYLEKKMSQSLYGKDKGFYIKSVIPTSYIAVVEAFGTNKADFAALTTFSYILTKDIKKYPVEALVTFERGNGEAYYKSQIIVHKDSTIKSLDDLKGKKFAFTDPASTSGYILPNKLLKDHNVKLGETVFAQKHDNVVTMVYQKQVDAGATFYSPPEKVMKEGKEVMMIRDARSRVLTQFPDVEKKVKILEFSQPIPNEPWVIRTNLYKDEGKTQKVKDLLREALVEYSLTQEGHKALSDLYDISKLVKVEDGKYKDIRDLILSSNLDLDKMLRDSDNKMKSKKK